MLSNHLAPLDDIMVHKVINKTSGALKIAELSKRFSDDIIWVYLENSKKSKSNVDFKKRLKTVIYGDDRHC